MAVRSDDAGSAAAPASRARRAAVSEAAPMRPRGSNHVGMRQFNERVVLHAIRLHGHLPKAEIARLTRLTPQTVQVIIGRLEADALVARRAPVRGKIGQPSVPMALNPDGAFSIGIKIGRRDTELLLVDFAGQVRERIARAHGFPDPEALFADLAEQLPQLVERLPATLRPRLHGIGVAAPLSLEGWHAVLGIEPRQAARWAGVDIRARIAALTPLPVEFVKDTAAACVAELVAGRGRQLASFLYVFVDAFIGGGLVIDSHLRVGRHGNAGAIASMPVPGTDPAAHLVQLVEQASLVTLDARYAAAGVAGGAALDTRALRRPWWPHTEAWLAEAAPAIALAVGQAACLLDLDGVIVDGVFSRELLATTLTAVNHALDRYDWQGVVRPELLEGTIGPDAIALGGALLPLHANFAPDHALFLKLGA